MIHWGRQRTRTTKRKKRKTLNINQLGFVSAPAITGLFTEYLLFKKYVLKLDPTTSTI